MLGEPFCGCELNHVFVCGDDLSVIEQGHDVGYGQGRDVG
jgi:hypothetical protein